MCVLIKLLELSTGYFYPVLRHTQIITSADSQRICVDLCHFILPGHLTVRARWFLNPAPSSRPVTSHWQGGHKNHCPLEDLLLSWMKGPRAVDPEGQKTGKRSRNRRRSFATIIGSRTMNCCLSVFVLSIAALEGCIPTVTTCGF